MMLMQNSAPKNRSKNSSKNRLKHSSKNRSKNSPTHRPNCRIRPIEQRDILAITEIYALYVETSYASFETIAPDVEEMRLRMKSLSDNGYPALVAVTSGSEGEGSGEGENGGEEVQAEEVIGYAYTAPYKARNAYKHTIENSIYVKKCYLKLGIGKALLEALIAEASRRGFWQMIATIGKREGEGSIKLHEALGFSYIGTAVGIGCKFEQLVDVVYMQKKLATKN